MRAFPQSPGGILCYNLVKQIEAKSANIMTERVWNEPLPTIRVTYRNVTKVYFRLVHQDWLERVKSGQYRSEWLDDAQRQAVLAEKPDRAWSADLPPTEDYRERTEDMRRTQGPEARFLLPRSPATMPSFSGRTTSSRSRKFGSASWHWFLRQNGPNGRFGGFVLDAASGEPIEGADVQVYAWDWNNQFRQGEKVRTDRNGLFSVAGIVSYNNLLYVTHAGQELATANNFYSNVLQQQPDSAKAGRLLHRPLALSPRPDDRLQGIAMLVDQENDNYEVVPHERSTIIFSDVNGKEIARQSVVSNDYGSFSGSFTAPRDRLMGRMMIHGDRLPGNAVDQRRGIQAAQVPSHAGRPQDRCQAGRRSRAARQSHGLHRRGHRRGEGPLPRRPRGSLSRLVVLVLRLADAAESRHARKSRTARPKPRPTARSRSSSSPSPTRPWPKKTSRSSVSRSRPT